MLGYNHQLAGFTMNLNRAPLEHKFCVGAGSVLVNNIPTARRFRAGVRTLTDGLGSYWGTSVEWHTVFVRQHESPLPDRVRAGVCLSDGTPRSC